MSEIGALLLPYLRRWQKEPGDWNVVLIAELGASPCPLSVSWHGPRGSWTRVIADRPGEYSDTLRRFLVCYHYMTTPMVCDL